jgi:hypothetical protein
VWTLRVLGPFAHGRRPAVGACPPSRMRGRASGADGQPQKANKVERQAHTGAVAAAAVQVGPLCTILRESPLSHGLQSAFVFCKPCEVAASAAARVSGSWRAGGPKTPTAQTWHWQSSRAPQNLTGVTCRPCAAPPRLAGAQLFRRQLSRPRGRMQQLQQVSGLPAPEPGRCACLPPERCACLAGPTCHPSTQALTCFKRISPDPDIPSSTPCLPFSSTCCNVPKL